MDSNLNASKEAKEEHLNISADVNLKYNHNTIKSEGIEREIFYDINKRGHRNTVYSQRPLEGTLNTETRSLFSKGKFNSHEFLKRKHLFILSKYEKLVEESSNINKKLEENTKEIEELNSELKKLKEEKKKKQADIVNFLSKKESLEEIYKNQISYLINNKAQTKAKEGEKEINLKSDSLKSQKSNESENFNIDKEKELDIKIEEIKKSDKTKFSEQVISFAEEILQKKGDEEIKNKIKSKVKIAYNIFFSEISSNSPVNYDSVISHFFSRIGLYISNHSLGQYSEVNVNKFLRCLIKINSINVQIAHILKFLNKKYKEKKTEMKSRINNLKKSKENLKEKKIVNDNNIEKYEKIIQKNKEKLQNIKQNPNFEEYEKRKYMVHTLDRSRFKKDNNLKILTDDILIQNKLNNTGIEKEEDIENLTNIALTSVNALINKDPSNSNERTNQKKLRKLNNSKSKEKENKKDENIKIQEELPKNNYRKNIIITKSTKFTLKKSTKQINVNDQNKPKDNQSNDFNTESKTVNSNSNLNYYDDSKDVDSEVNSKNLNNSNLVNQNYIVIKNDINIKNIKGKNDSNNINNRYQKNIKIDTLKASKSNNLSNNNIIKNSNYTKKEKIQNNIINNKNIFNENKNEVKQEENVIFNKKNYNYPKPKYNKNIYIINNINNSEQIQTKNNIYGNKSNNLNINTTGNLNYDNYNKNFNRTERKINYTTTKDKNTNEVNKGNNGRNRLAKINNNIQSNNSNRDNDKKIKSNYNFHDIFQVNQNKTNRIYNQENNVVIKSQNSTNNVVNTRNSEKKLKQDKRKVQQIPSSLIIDIKKNPNIYPKNSYDYRSVLNKVNNIKNSNNINKNSVNTDNDNISKQRDNIQKSFELDKKNTKSYMISLYSRRNEKKEEKK